MFVDLLNGQHHQLQRIPLKGGGNCNVRINNRKPSPSMNCDTAVNVNYSLQNGEKLCIMYEISSGGFFQYFDFGMTSKGFEEFTPQTETKTLCLKYDNKKPVHCLSDETAPCNKTLIELDKRITKTGNITVLLGDGWKDPWPKSASPNHASGIKKFVIEIHDVRQMGSVLEVDKGSLNPPLKEEFGNLKKNMTFVLPKSPALYCVMLEVHDNAGNVRFARRFVLFDNDSTIKINTRNPLLVSSSSKVTNYKWQVNHRSVSMKWKNRYYNSYYIKNNLLAHIRPDVNNAITGVYDQLTGQLPVNGTRNIHGLTGFSYSYSLNHGPFSPQKYVSDFENESVCLNLILSDGDTYTFIITAEDVMENRLSENVTVHIDRTVPDVKNMWLVRKGNNGLYVHPSTDLSHMLLQFEAKDPHSGIRTIEWFLGTQKNKTEIGQRALPVIKDVPKNKCKSDQHCYCPSIGPCAYFNYTVKLNSLIEKNTNTGKHNREYYFTLIATNEAMLKSVYHLDILVDASPPVAGVVREGSPDRPDIDYTSEDYININMHGFIDHESGIRFYLVALAKQCLSLDEIKNDLDNKSVTVYKTVDPEIRIKVPNKGSYITSVVAFNNAMEPSPVACSNGITKDITNPELVDIRLEDGRIHDGLWCKPSRVFYVHVNMTLTELHNTHTCKTKCKNTVNVGYIDALPLTLTTIEKNTSEKVCSRCEVLSNQSTVYLPSNTVYLQWKTVEAESQIKDYYFGIGSDTSKTDDQSLLPYQSTHGKESAEISDFSVSNTSSFYIFVKVVNEANLTSSRRIGPVLINESPPKLKEDCEHNVTYGYYCEKLCAGRHCYDISSCDVRSGRCVQGCQPGWKDSDCSKVSPQKAADLVTIIISGVSGICFLLVLTVLVFCTRRLVLRRRSSSKEQNVTTVCENSEYMNCAGVCENSEYMKSFPVYENLRQF